MNDSNNYVEKERNPFPWARLFLGLTSVILVIVIFLLFIKFCEKKSLSDDLLKAGKKYYEEFPTNLPNTVGQCFTVSLEELENNHYINSKKYSDCDKTATYVNVCYLETKNYHYSAILSCDSETSSYDVWKDGKESDLTDKSDIRFKFLGQELTLGTKYYYPSDKTLTTEVSEYYADTPDENYTQKEDEQTGYKWYVNKEQKSYYKDYSSTQPNGYSNKGESKVVTNYSLNEPNKASYRTIENATLYRYKKVSYQYKWQCWDGVNSAISMISSTPCALRDDSLKQLKKVFYSCDGQNETESGKVCADFTNWTVDACQESKSKGIVCENQSGYKYTDTMWKWYKNSSVKKYYPSNATSADEEKTYYVNSPADGAIKDEGTKTTVFKFYKIEEGTGSLEKWTDVTNGYVTEEELIKSFNNKGFDVKTLNDIDKLEKIRYHLQLQYRNLNK